MSRSSRRSAPSAGVAAMMTKAPMTTLVLALGNPLRGDDGVGAAVLNALPALPPGVTGMDGGTPGLGLVLSLQGYDRAIILDAAEMGEMPGTWRRFTRTACESRTRTCAEPCTMPV
jgi:hydrogenase maturation protease